jgi:hypothetical protein
MGKASASGSSLFLLSRCARVFNKRCCPSNGRATHLHHAVKEWSHNTEDGSHVAGMGRAMEGRKPCASRSHMKVMRRRPRIHCASLEGSKCLRDRMASPCIKIVDQVGGGGATLKICLNILTPQTWIMRRATKESSSDLPATRSRRFPCRLAPGYIVAVMKSWSPVGCRGTLTLVTMINVALSLFAL